jgi:hypothetical protein
MSNFDELSYSATKEDKKRIINDWLKLFPSYHIKGSSNLIKRCDPFLVGIYLDYDRANCDYVPTFFVTNLIVSSYGTLSIGERCKESPQNNEFWIKIMEHENLFKKASNILMANFNVFLDEKPIHLSAFLYGFKKCLKVGGYSETNVLKDLSYICGYFSRDKEVDRYVNAAVDIIKAYNDISKKKVLSWENVNSIQEWETKIRKECSSPKLLHEMVSQRISEAKMEKFTNVPLVID